MTYDTIMNPEQAPDGIECHFADTWLSRPFITPRLLLIHTNGASVESTLAAQLRWANAAHDNTHPHYVVDRKGAAWKTMPSNRRGICNYLADAFGLSIETTDLGWPTPGDACGFTPEQAETVARIVAWESELWQFPIITPTAWDGTGVAAHTDPFTYPYWTKYAGKACPGRQKKLEVRSIILPRANELRFPPTTTPTENPMPALDKPERPFSSFGGYGLVGGKLSINLAPEHADATSADIYVAVFRPSADGYLVFWDGTGSTPVAASLNFAKDSISGTLVNAPVRNGQVTVLTSTPVMLELNVQAVSK